MIKKKLLSMMISAVLAFSLVGCSSATDKMETPAADTTDTTVKDASASEEVVEINFYEHTDNEVIARALAEAYMAQNKNVKVNVSIIANDDYDDKITVLLSGGADVDVFWVRGGAKLRQLAETGAIYDMSDLITENNVDTSIYGSMQEAFIKDGSTYGLSTSKSCWLLWYNKDLFDAAGLEYPVNLTWEEYSALAKSLTTEDLWGGVCPNWTMNLGATAVGEYLTDENLTRTMDYAKLLERWYITDKSHPSIEEMSGSFDLNAFFAEGKTYMMINGDWEFLLFGDANPAFEWCAAPLPVFDDAAAESTVGSTSCFSISAKSEKAAAAFDFIKFCNYSDEGASIYAAHSAVPAFPSDAALAVYNESVTVPGTEYVFSAKVGLEQGLENSYDELNTAFKEELNDALVGNASLEEAFTAYKDRRSEILAK
ncbi:MAG: extracellular solute-binding protein [Mobilitalea sp.]